MIERDCVINYEIAIVIVIVWIRNWLATTILIVQQLFSARGGNFRKNSSSLMADRFEIQLRQKVNHTQRCSKIISSTYRSIRLRH